MRDINTNTSTTTYSTLKIPNNTSTNPKENTSTTTPTNIINLNPIINETKQLNNKRLEVGRLNIEKIKKEDNNNIERKIVDLLDKKSHRKTPSAFEFNPMILSESNLDMRNYNKTKHQRNRSQVDSLEAVLNNSNKNENSSFIIKNTNEVSLINYLNNNGNHVSDNFHSGKNLVVPNLLNLQNLNNQLQDNQIYVYNTERGKDKTIKNILDEFYRKPAATNRSDRTKTSSIFSIKDKDSEKLKIHSGPVDLNCIMSLAATELLERISEYLIKKKISFVQTNP